MTWKTMQEWNEKGRYITKGQKCKLRDPDGNCLWSKEQTKKGREWTDREYVDYENFGADYDYDSNHDYGEYMYGAH